ncbi:MAG: anti-sigma factor antagonist [Opitutae bacterium]|nr:anti-sigma factor antagonist [Opitutae bacterium]
MAEENDPVFLVDPHSEPIRIRIYGRANFLNCSPLRTFFRKMIAQNRRSFELDFTDCTGMDSTCLGILAGAALDLKRNKPNGVVCLAGLSERNLDLIKNLGLHRIVQLLETPRSHRGLSLEVGVHLQAENLTEEKKKEMLIGAHEDLVEVDRKNLPKFENLLNFLRSE